MTALELHRYVAQYNIEWRWQDNNGTPDVLILPNYLWISEFMEILDGYNGDEGTPCIIKDGYFAIWMNEICERAGIDIEAVFPKQ